MDVSTSGRNGGPGIQGRGDYTMPGSYSRMLTGTYDTLQVEEPYSRALSKSVPSALARFSSFDECLSTSLAHACDFQKRRVINSWPSCGQSSGGTGGPL